MRDCGHLYRRARAAFQARFWNPERGCLYDVVDADHVPGRNDPSFRPNQILAVGGLPFQLLDEPQASRVVDAVERELVTPMGLRSLARGEPGYRPRYEGGPVERDSAYHQGTAWPWLIGPFVEAWLRVRGDTDEARREAKARFLDPLLAAPGRGRDRPPGRDRRRRAAARAARLPVPGLVGGRAAAGLVAGRAAGGGRHRRGRVLKPGR